MSQLPKNLETGIYYGWASVDNDAVHKMVISVGWNPYYKNEHKSMVRNYVGLRCALNSINWLRGFVSCPLLELLQQISRTCQTILTHLKCVVHKVNSQNLAYQQWQIRQTTPWESPHMTMTQFEGQETNSHPLIFVGNAHSSQFWLRFLRKHT